jgi:alanine dehydrogenase
MIVGVPREIKEGENRVALNPAGAHILTGSGHRVLVEAGAGEQSGISDAEYRAGGAEVLRDVSRLWDLADMIVKVKEPLPAEFGYFKPGQILFTYLHLASSKDVTKALLKGGVTAIGYETLETSDHQLPLLVPMSEVAGKLAAQSGAIHLQKHNGGRGVLLGGVPGVAPAEVVILGCGAVGLNAAKVAMGMGAHVTIMDIDHSRLKYLDDIVHGNAFTVFADPLSIAHAASYADLLIGAVLRPGARTPHLVTEAMVKAMKPGSVIVDVAIDQGGCVATSKPTTHAKPTYIKHEVVHYCVTNIPSAVPRTSTFALTNATISYVRSIADLGIEEAAGRDPAIARGLNTQDGKIIHPAVREAFPALGRK